MVFVGNEHIFIEFIYSFKSMASNSAETPRLISPMSLRMEKTRNRLIGPVEITISIAL